MSVRLSVLGLSKRFGGIVAADDVSFELGDGECLGLIGPNGAGKTTVFAMVAGELDADDGSVIFGGSHVEHMASYRRARRGMARTYQRLEVFPDMTVREHLLVAQSAHRGSTGVLRDLVGRGQPSRAELDHADEVLAQVGIAQMADAVVGTLSLGSCRLVELARALVTEPTVLLADEPSSGLDSYETRAMAKVLAELQERRGLSIILVEHDLSIVAALTERVLVMDVGRIIAQGSFEAVMADERVHQAYLGAAR
jgi:branched-chain amino acid transport system ATP-binding protein